MKITFSTEGEEISFRKRDIKQISKTRNTERKQGTQTRKMNHAKRTIISKYRNKDRKKKSIRGQTRRQRIRRSVPRVSGITSGSFSSTSRRPLWLSSFFRMWRLESSWWSRPCRFSLRGRRTTITTTITTNTIRIPPTTPMMIASEG